jgi:toxin HigB-1
MIVSYADDETELIAQGRRSPKFPEEIQAAAFRKLGYVQAAILVDDLRQPPSNRLQKLVGDREGQWSIRINDKWRVCFRWLERQPSPSCNTPTQGDAYDVEINNHYG